MNHHASLPSRLRRALATALGTHRFSVLASEIARVLDLRWSDAARMLVGGIRPTAEHLDRLERLANVSRIYLTTGEGAPLANMPAAPHPVVEAAAPAPKPAATEAPAKAAAPPRVSETAPYVLSTALSGSTPEERAVMATVLEACFWERIYPERPDYRLRRLLTLIRRLDRWRADEGAPVMIGLRRSLRLWLNSLSYTAADQLGEDGSRALLEEFGFMPKAGRSSVVRLEGPQIAAAAAGR